jgi:hypothetical protein
MASNPDPLEAVEHSHSGRLLLRMPKSLHAQLAARSDRDGVSLNHWIVNALSRALLSDDGAADPESRRVPPELRVVLIVNAVVIAAAVAIAIALIVIAWH